MTDVVWEKLIERRVYQVWAAAVDPTLTSDGLISPGLGDTVCPVFVVNGGRRLTWLFQGDRLYNTLRP